MANLPLKTPTASSANLPDLQARLDRWHKRLLNPTELQLPTDYPRSTPFKMVEAQETFDLSPQASLLCLQLSMALQPSDASPFTVLLAAFAVLLHRYTGEEDLVVSSSSETLNPLLLRFTVKPTDTFMDVLRMVQQVMEEAGRDEVPFGDLMAAYLKEDTTGSVADARAAPSMFRVRFFNQTDADSETMKMTTTAATDFTVMVRQQVTESLRQLQPRMELRVAYNQVLFSKQRIQHMVSQLEMVLAAAGRTLMRQEAAEEDQVGWMKIASELDSQITPDPTEDLGWDQFPGSITSIFAKNARQHPDRRFLVESVERPQGEVERSFTYGQVFGAARALSRCLREQGIEKEDVVVVYAYRGADLVVAIMGVLMAGATYSVIDPAYPPARQQVYLSVAQPRGLVVLRHAGELATEVQEYVDKELQIKCTVPGLELLDDGSVRGSADSNDQLAKAAAAVSKDSLDDVVEVGPENIGTLSFTSGSTGIPKGVCGRHFSLTHFYQWMAEEFHLTSSERFTMLSGIAHDPVQRDVFTPVFLGAELHIPTAADIGEPGRLAQWMSEHRVSVTHLTPAMGQLVAANADATVKDLRLAFFVGDLLTKRDCQRLQSLAGNCQIINMYGTTETQRAVSYFPIPSLNSNARFLTSVKDVIPTGTGMRNVQLLVVNRHGSGSLCGVGEVGEIYVRSGGLARGYLRKPEATAEKFVQSWFSGNHGERDRMYRSGDLGRYRSDGAVEVIGRIDDQVKIRGFRVELGEINNMLIQHPQIRAAVTLVRRDKNEEQTLVAYIVATDSSELIASVRDHLKQKLPTYAVPAVFVPMTRLPLTPNGKIDKAALPFPDTPLVALPTASGTAEPLAPHERALMAVWATVLGLPKGTELPADTSFFDAGGHSVLATRLVFKVRAEFAVDAPLALVFKHPTLREMAAAVESLRRDLQPVTTSVEAEEEKQESLYAADLEKLLSQVPAISGSIRNLPDSPTYLLTGATGFLGAFVLAELLQRYPQANVICLVRAKDTEAAMERVRQAAVANLVWRPEWEQRVSAVKGDLSEPRLGLSNEEWQRLGQQTDAIVHNGALVHWVYPYAKLRSPNVLATLDVLKLSVLDHPKPTVFVSSTSALDSAHYTQLDGAVRESDDLEGSRQGLMSGYAQSKWVAERLFMAARRNGLPVTIVRPGYVLGHSRTGATNTDDFIWRLVKGCLELGQSPVMANVVNLCPVDYVASVVVAAVAQPHSLDHLVYHVVNQDHYRFQDLFDGLRHYGYQVVDTEYMRWRGILMDHTLANNDSALYPLLHFVLDDLPTSTKSAPLDDRHTRHLLDPIGVSCPTVECLVGVYLAYLVKAGFLDPPNVAGKMELPELDIEIKGLVSRGN